MKVRARLIGHHVQTVSAVVVLGYVKSSTAAKPRKLLAAAPARPLGGAQRRADRPGLARVRVCVR